MNRRRCTGRMSKYKRQGCVGRMVKAEMAWGMGGMSKYKQFTERYGCRDEEIVGKMDGVYHAKGSGRSVYGGVCPYADSAAIDCPL